MSINLDHIDPGNAHGSVRIPALPPSPPTVITWACNECDAGFDEREHLRKHKLENHPLKRPSLHIRGLAASSHRYVITRPLTPHCLHFDNTQYVEIEGKRCESIMAAVELLAPLRRERLRVRLGYSTYATDYDLRFDVLEDDIAERIERDFLEAAVAGSLAGSLENFNHRVRDLSEGKGYAAALQAYITAMMAKDGVAGTMIPVQDYPSKLGECLDGLEILDRPFTRALTSLIRFMQNDLRSLSDDRVFPFLVQVKRALTAGELPVQGLFDHEATFAVPLDRLTERLVNFVVSGRHHRDREGEALANSLGSGHISEIDAYKVRLALVAWGMESGNRALALTQQRQLAHHPTFFEFAKQMTEGRP